MNPELSLQDKVALITGGASGIGRATAHEFARHGARIFIVDLAEESLETTRQELCSAGATVQTLVADVSQDESMFLAVQRVEELYGQLDIVYANAGVNGAWGSVEELDAQDFDLTIGVNLKGTFLTIKHTVPLLKRNGGSILITASINGTSTFGLSGASLYGASKAGQIALTKMLAVELGPYKIRVNAICPGAIKTQIHQGTTRKKMNEKRIRAHFPDGMHPLTGHDFGDAIQVARTALFLASEMADHITGEVLVIDGGASLIA